jgi:hypothetical protein
MLSAFTANFVLDFFPGLHRILYRIAEQVDYELVTCHGEEIVQEAFGQQIRNTTLLPTQLAGLVIGIYGSMIVSRNASKSWFWAMLYFAGMNLTSIFCHNLTEKYTIEWKVFRLLDIVFTGASAGCLLFSQLRLPSIFNLLIFPALLIFNYKYDFGEGAIAFVPEFTYIGMMLIAVLFLLPKLQKISTSKLGYGSSIIGLLLLIIGLPIDSILCEYSTQVSSVHLIFLGSDFAMLGLSLLASTSSEVLEKKLK